MQAKLAKLFVRRPPARTCGLAPHGERHAWCDRSGTQSQCRVAVFLKGLPSTNDMTCSVLLKVYNARLILLSAMVDRAFPSQSLLRSPFFFLDLCVLSDISDSISMCTPRRRDRSGETGGWLRCKATWRPVWPRNSTAVPDKASCVQNATSVPGRVNQ